MLPMLNIFSLLSDIFCENKNRWMLLKWLLLTWTKALFQKNTKRQYKDTTARLYRLETLSEILPTERVGDGGN